MPVLRRWRTVRGRWPYRILVLLSGAVPLAGCASYTREPLDADALIRTLEQRSPAHANVAAADGLTLQQAEVVALFYNPAVRTARLKAQVPVLSATEAGRWDDPELSADVLRILEDVEKPWIIGSSLAFTLPISGRLATEKSKATAEGRAALVEAWVTEQQVLRELREAWVRREARQRALAASGDMLGDLDGVVEITDRLEKAGELITAESVAFRLVQSRARLDEQRLAMELAEVERQIVSILGLLPGAPVALAARADAVESEPLPPQEALLAGNPSVLQRAAEYDVAEESLRLEIRRQYPDIQLGPAYGSEEGEDRLGVGFSMPLPILNRNRRGIAEATAARQAARAAWDESVQLALNERAILQANLRAAESRRSHLADEVAPLASAQWDEARRLVDHGEVNALLLLEALNNRRETALELIESETEIALLQVAIHALAPGNSPSSDAQGEPVK